MLPESSFSVLPAEAHRISRSVTAPAGYRAAGVAAGIKASNRLDLGILLSDSEAVSAALFTRNTAAAAPVRVTREECACSRLRGVVVNSGNANACSGAVGIQDARRMQTLLAECVGLPPDELAVCSTGVIGASLPMPQVERGITLAASQLAYNAGNRFAAAIRTTDRTQKHGALQVDLPEGKVHLGFAAKGAGMISPHLATMLCYVTCDAIIDASDWASLIEGAVEDSFNLISVDGQESTNDTVLAFSNGGSGVRVTKEGRGLLAETLRAALLSLALAIVADGEGATKVVELSVRGAKDDCEAHAVARAIANSPLVKAAFYGEDPNWGRMVQSAGQALAELGVEAAIEADVDYGAVKVLREGLPVDLDGPRRRELQGAMRRPEQRVAVDLRRGDATARIYFSDLTHQYVTFNAEYTT